MASALAHVEAQLERSVWVEVGSPHHASVLVVTSDRERCALTPERLSSVGAGRVWLAHARDTALEAARTHQPEVAIVELGFQECEGPAIAFQLRMAARHLETVLFAGARQEAEIAAALDLGLGRVVPSSELFPSLARVLAPLAECVRLRRRLEDAEHRVRRLSDEESRDASSGRVSLHEAERRYRETYIRSLLAESGNRREAARRAGIPYTTLCEIIRKLGI